MQFGWGGEHNRRPPCAADCFCAVSGSEALVARVLPALHVAAGCSDALLSAIVNLKALLVLKSLKA